MSFIDGVPVISQGKSALQIYNGDPEGAKQTQENFFNQCPIISQSKSALQVINGDFRGAKQTQTNFFYKHLEPLSNALPIIGQTKGLIHMAVGDVKRGKEIIRDANENTIGAVIGGIFAGPIGAAVGIGLTASHTKNSKQK